MTDNIPGPSLIKPEVPRDPTQDIETFPLQQKVEKKLDPVAEEFLAKTTPQREVFTLPDPQSPQKGWHPTPMTKELIVKIGMVSFALIFVAVAGLTIWRNSKDDQAASTPSPEFANPAVTEGAPAASEITQSQNQAAAPPVAAPTPSTTQQSGLAACGVIGMPEGVCTVIKSIEADGVNNNPNITANTSTLPEGTRAEIDESSWLSTAPETGTLKGKIIINGTEYNGTLYVRIVGSGAWTVNDYSID